MNSVDERRVASLRQLLDFEKHKCREFRDQQNRERAMPHGRPEQFARDIESCEAMIRPWTDRLASLTALLNPT